MLVFEGRLKTEHVGKSRFDYFAIAHKLTVCYCCLFSDLDKQGFVNYCCLGKKRRTGGESEVVRRGKAQRRKG